MELCSVVNTVLSREEEERRGCERRRVSNFCLGGFYVCQDVVTSLPLLHASTFIRFCLRSVTE